MSLAKRQTVSETDKIPKSLVKLAFYWSEPANWDKSLKQVCEELNLKYSTVKYRISKFGYDRFYSYRNELLKKAAMRLIPKVFNALFNQAAKGNMKAIELILKMTGDIDNGLQVVQQASNQTVIIINEINTGENNVADKD